MAFRTALHVSRRLVLTSQLRLLSQASGFAAMPRLEPMIPDPGKGSLGPKSGFERLAPPGEDGVFRILLAGDAAICRGLDQLLPTPSEPTLYESFISDARMYVKLAEDANGRVEKCDGADAYSRVIGYLKDVRELARPDATLVNLETSVTACPRHEPKGINYRMHPDNIDILKVAHIDAVSLANNHVMDWTTRGLTDTLDCLSKAGVGAAGAGRSLEEAQAAQRIPLSPPDPSTGFDGPSVLLVSMAHGSSGVPHSWAATAQRPGVWRTDLSDRDVSAAAAALAAARRSPGDIAIVSIHWGGNWDFSVPQEQRRFAHELIDAGVDVVWGHSSHHVKGLEFYNQGLVLFGCGDLLNDYEGIQPGGHEDKAGRPMRDDVGAAYAVDVRAGGPGGNAVLRIAVYPTMVRQLSLKAPDDAAWRYIEATLEREWRALGGRGVMVPDRSRGVIEVLPAARRERRAACG